MSDEELANFLGIGSDPRWPKVISKLTQKQRDLYEHMYWVEQELNAGRRPAGVIVCHDH